jgi:hypothetical protein
MAAAAATDVTSVSGRMADVKKQGRWALPRFTSPSYSSTTTQNNYNYLCPRPRPRPPPTAPPSPSSRPYRTAFIPFLVACDPTPDTTVAALKALDALVADVIELGVPYSDPLADGPTIQAAATRALEGGATLDKVLAVVAAAAPHITAPVVLFTYYNPIMARGLEAFCAQARALGAPPSLRLVAASGEPLPRALLRRLRAALPGRAVLNLYGCTEVAADVACLECSALDGEGMRGAGGVPVGAPVPNTVLAIAAVKEEASAGGVGGAVVRLLPVHQVGEVLVGGLSLAGGYLDEPAATAARFVGVPLGQLKGKYAAGGDGGWRLGALGGRVRLFRTGDLGFVDASGALHIAGRVDLQVKLQGGLDLNCHSFVSTKGSCLQAAVGCCCAHAHVPAWLPCFAC